MNYLSKVKLLSGTLILTAGMLFLAAACDNNKEVESLKAETMRIHDEAMKDMGPMNARSRQLKKEIAELDSLSPRRDSLFKIVSAIEKAEEGMMNWMSNYKAPGDDMPKEEAIKYLQEQKAAIEKNLNEIRAASGK